MYQYLSLIQSIVFCLNFSYSVIQYLIDEYKVDPNSIISNKNYVNEENISYYNDIYIDLGNYLSIYLSGGHISQSEIDNPLDLKPDTKEKKFFCINTAMVNTI